MDINFKYSDIISQAQMLAAFEGRDYVNDSGESMFSSVVITEQDLPLIKSYISQAFSTIAERLDRMIDAFYEEEEEVVLSLRTEQTRYPNAQSAALVRHFKEAIVSYIMAQWLAERKASRVAMYSELWNGSVELATKNLFRKAAPKRKQINHSDIDEVTIRYEEKSSN